MPQSFSGDTAWVLASSALVLLMTPGLAFFYGGMVRTKSVINMMLMSMSAIGIVSVLWVAYGYSLAFTDSGSGWIGKIAPSHLGSLVNDLANNGAKLAIPVLVFSAFQLMFAVITPALISGSIADRTKFISWVVFVIVWVTVVYFPVAHWVFYFGNASADGKTITGAGWLAAKGVEDFAGGTAVHINAGAAALAMALLLGRRVGFRKEPMRPHSLPLVMIGTGLLWFGWFGFNAGSALSANGLAGLAFMNTQVATAAALAGWLIVERLRDGHATGLGAASGAVAGLVAITPACAFVTPTGAIFIGLIAGAICAYAVGLKYKFNLDDSLDVVGVHLVGGIVGTLSIGFFGAKAVNSVGLNGLFYGGDLSLLRLQATGAFSVLAFSFIMTLIIGKLIDLTIGLRIDRDSEIEGIDSTEHAETAYELDSRTGGGHFATAYAGTEA